jgi:hypothetical protein
MIVVSDVSSTRFAVTKKLAVSKVRNANEKPYSNPQFYCCERYSVILKLQLRVHAVALYTYRYGIKYGAKAVDRDQVLSQTSCGKHVPRIIMQSGG